MIINNDILNQATDSWGRRMQIEKMIEECGELIVALQKFKYIYSEPPPDVVDVRRMIRNVIDEIADVTIMMQQAELIFGEKEIQDVINFKMNRLSIKIHEENDTNISKDQDANK